MFFVLAGSLGKSGWVNYWVLHVAWLVVLAGAYWKIGYEVFLG